MKKYAGDIFYYVLTGCLGWMVYTGDYTYLNLVDIVYILLLLFVTIFAPLLGLIFIGGHKEESVTLMMKKWQEGMKKGLVKTIYKYILFAITVTLLVLSGHTFLVVWYIISTFMCIGLTKLTNYLLAKGE